MSPFDGPVRDETGRILDGVTFDSTEEEIAEAIARRDALDAANLDVLRRAGALDNAWT